MGGALALAAQPGAGFTSELPEICEYRAKLTELMQRPAVFSPTAKRCSCHFENASLSGRFIASCIGIFARSIKPCLRSSHHFLDSIQVISRSFGPVQIGLPDCLKGDAGFFRLALIAARSANKSYSVAHPAEGVVICAC